MLMFEEAMVVSADVAEDLTDGKFDGVTRGDDVLVLEFDGPNAEGERVCIHLRRGMDIDEVASGLRTTASLIENDRT